MAILVTGGAGYTGSQVCIELLKQSYDVVVVDNFLTTTSIGSINRIRQAAEKDFKLYAIDLGQKDLVNRIFEENEIEGVIHFAGIKCNGIYKKNPMEYYYTNLASTIILCEAMQEHDVKKILFSSSEGFYGDNGSDTTTYGSAKLMIEKILHEAYSVDPTWSIRIVRYLVQGDNVYSKKDVKVEDMAKLFIEEFKKIVPEQIETYTLKIAEKSLSVEPGENFLGYKVEDFSFITQ